MPRRFTDEEVEQRMVKEIADALYPVLIPMEEQCLKIQAENRLVIEAVALQAWRNFGVLYKNE